MILPAYLSTNSVGYFKRQVLHKKMVQLLCDNFSGSISETKQIKKRYTLWNKGYGIIVQNTKEKIFLPFTLKSEMCLDISIAFFLKSVVFKELPETVLRALSSLISKAVFLPGDIIYQQNILKDKLVILIHLSINNLLLF